MKQTIAKAVIIAIALVAMVIYVHRMMQPAYLPPDPGEEVKMVSDGVAQARAKGTAPTAPDRVRREDAALKYLQGLVASNKRAPHPENISHIVFMPPGTWPADKELALGVAELYSTYFHAGGDSKKTSVMQDYGYGSKLAAEKDDGDMELVDQSPAPDATPGTSSPE